MMVAQEGLERLAVRLDAVGPVILAHQLARLGERSSTNGSVTLVAEVSPRCASADGLRLLEGLEHRRRQPGMLLGQRRAARRSDA